MDMMSLSSGGEFVGSGYSSVWDLDIAVTNIYTKEEPMYSVDDYSYGDNIGEPYRTSTITVSGVDSGHTISFAVDDGEVVHAVGTVYTSEEEYPDCPCDVSVEWTFKQPLGWQSITVSEETESGAVRDVTEDVIVKYVRREMRTLTDYDRESYFNAVAILQRVPTEVGMQLYGEDYKSKDYFNRIHMYFGGTKDCDHWHQGAGFVTTHVTFTLVYEKAVQSVYPWLSQPYWDFTLESTFYDADTWRTSPVFSDDWFGDAGPDNDMHTPNEGRFSYVRTMDAVWDFGDVHNSYGLLRAPWNNDPTPFMTRSSQVYGFENNIKPSGCAEFHRSLKKTNWMSMSKQLNSAAHGHIHELMGGSWNHQYAEWLDGEVSPAILTFTHEIQALSKDLWRSNYLLCPEYCSLDTPWTECTCECSADAMGDLTSYEILDNAGVLERVEYYDNAGHLIDSWYDDDGTVYYTLPDYTTEESKHIYDSMLKLLCSPGHIGDMFQASSTNDITFWVLHGGIDRVWQYKRLGVEQGLNDFDETWDPYHVCYGHNPRAMQPFKNLFDNDDSYYTNAQLYDFLDPSNVDLPYMYDSFQWPHCELLGYDMSNVQKTSTSLSGDETMAPSDQNYNRR